MVAVGLVMIAAAGVVFVLMVASLFAINKPPTPEEDEARRRILSALDGEGDYSSAELESMMRSLAGVDGVVE